MTERYGIRADAPRGWHVSIRRDSAPVAAGARSGTLVAGWRDINRPVLHAATVQIPSMAGDFGGGLVERLGREDAFVALIEYGPESAGYGLFERQGFPLLAPSAFSPNRAAQYVPGQSAAQKFFSIGNRAFCLYAVVGEHSRRMATVPQVVRVVRTMQVARPVAGGAVRWTR